MDTSSGGSEHTQYQELPGRERSIVVDLARWENFALTGSHFGYDLVVVMQYWLFNQSGEVLLAYQRLSGRLESHWGRRKL